jgi:hypothetical protein
MRATNLTQITFFLVFLNPKAGFIQIGQPCIQSIVLNCCQQFVNCMDSNTHFTTMYHNFYTQSSTHLFGNVKCSASIFMFPVTPECFTQNRVVGLFQTFRFLIETRQIPLHHEFHPIKWIFFECGSEKKKQADSSINRNNTFFQNSL